MLNSKQFLQAMSIISENHSNTVRINRVAGQTVKENSENVRLEIIDCVPSVINKLKANGFSLGMSNGALTVSKIG